MNVKCVHCVLYNDAAVVYTLPQLNRNMKYVVYSEVCSMWRVWKDTSTVHLYNMHIGQGYALLL